MASISTNAYSEGRYYTFSYSLSQDKAKNTTTINWTLSCAGGVSWYAERTLILNIAGDNVVNKTDRVKRYAGNIASGTKTFKTQVETDCEVARTLLCTMHKMHRSGVDNYVTYKKEKGVGGLRKLTPRECFRLMGFTDDFKIVVSDTQAYKQFGNSVVVPLMSSVASLIVEKLNSLKETDFRKNSYLYHNKCKSYVLNPNRLA